jgi:hypothetical protein
MRNERTRRRSLSSPVTLADKLIRVERDHAIYAVILLVVGVAIRSAAANAAYAGWFVPDSPHNRLLLLLRILRDPSVYLLVAIASAQGGNLALLRLRVRHGAYGFNTMEARELLYAGLSNAPSGRWPTGLHDATLSVPTSSGSPGEVPT